MATSQIRLPRPLEPVRLPETREELVEWGKAHGLDVPEHGRIPDVVASRFIDYRLRARRRLIRQGRHHRQ